MAKYANNADGKYLNVAPVSYGYITQDTGTNKGYSYSENETTATKSLKRTINLLATLYEYSVKNEEDKTTITENHFDKEFKTVIHENSIDYTTPNSAFSLTAEGDEASSKSNILKDGLPLITSEINYDENVNTISKTYSNGLSFSVAYDDKGNIISNERNSYEYDKYGELIQTTGAVNSSYTYDGRGNLLTKTVNGETTEFEYNNEWLDQLTAVNGTSLTYDVNGNLLTYGDAEYSWSRGRQLDSVTDGENSYSYTYDTNGIRASKKVNGRTTEFNVLGSKILAQDSIDGEIYFQYSGDELIGFYLNDVQYFYIKNLNGDIVGITDYDGNLIAEYEYDEWGKLLNITTAEEGNEEQLKIATANPFRYRGYYYDNETGYYYLQSRYYNPEWGRFISADDFSYINNTRLSRNAYCYCANNPIMRSDPTGKAWVSDVGIQVAEIISVIMATWDAFVQGGKDFAAYIAAQLTLDPSLLYQPGKNHFEQHLNFEKWMNEMYNDFYDFSNTLFYKFVKYFNDNFFIDFTTDILTNKSQFYRAELLKGLSAFIGFGNQDSLYANIKDLLDGYFEIINIENFSSGILLKYKEFGVRFQLGIEKFKNFYYGYILDLTVDFSNIDWNFPSLDGAFAFQQNYLNLQTETGYGLAIIMFIAFTMGMGALVLV